MQEADRLIEYLSYKESIKDVAPAIVTIVGYMWSGKTTLAKTIAALIQQAFPDEVNIFYARRFLDVAQYVKSNAKKDKSLVKKRYQMLIIDDAVRYAHSRRSMQNVDDTSEFFEVRHVFMKQGMERGIVAAFFLTQRWKSLDTIFRNAYAVIFKTVIAQDYNEQRELTRLLREHYRTLQDITRRIYLNKDNSAKKLSIIRWGDGLIHPFYLPFVMEPEDMIYVTPKQEKIDPKLYLVLGAYIVLRNMGYTKYEALQEMRKSGIKIRTQTYLQIVKAWEKGMGK